MSHSSYATPGTPQSIYDDESVGEYTPNTVPAQLYTPPRSHPAQAYYYGDPEEYQMVHDAEYHESTYYHTPPMPRGAAGMQTRSGRSAGSPMTPLTSSPSSRLSGSPRPKKRKDRKQDQTLSIVEPLSRMTREYEEPVMDMMAWANRPNEDRYREVEGKHKGKVPRPMNSFMLYRTAYKERIKRWGAQGDNNQLISRVAGLSWPLESAELKGFYAKCANVEKENHQAAFPNYKFAPNKHPKKRDRELDDESDAEWDGGSAYSTKRRRGTTDREMTRSRSTTPAQVPQYQDAAYHHSPYMTSNPDPRALAHMQAVGYYDQFGGHLMPSSQYYHVPVQPYPSHPQEFQYVPTSAPAHGHHYGGQLLGLPPTANDGLAAVYSLDHPTDFAIDPSLHEFQPPVEYQYGSASDRRNHASLEEAVIGLEGPTEAVVHPGMQMLAPVQSLWSPAGEMRNDFDAELDRWHEGP